MTGADREAAARRRRSARFRLELPRIRSRTVLLGGAGGRGANQTGMIAHLLLLATLVVAGRAPLVPRARRRARWADDASASLEGDGYSVARGALRYAPVGTISDPAGTYGRSSSTTRRPCRAATTARASTGAASPPRARGSSRPCSRARASRPRATAPTCCAARRGRVVGCTPPPAPTSGCRRTCSRASRLTRRERDRRVVPAGPAVQHGQLAHDQHDAGSCDERSAACAFVSTADRGSARGRGRGAGRARRRRVDPLAAADVGSGRAATGESPTRCSSSSASTSTRPARRDRRVRRGARSARSARCSCAPDDAPAPSPRPRRGARASRRRARARRSARSAAADATAAVVNRTAAARSCVELLQTWRRRWTLGTARARRTTSRNAACMAAPDVCLVHVDALLDARLLYEALGQMPLANSSVVFSGAARAVSLGTIGAPPELKQFAQLSCDANGTLFVASMCPDAACGSCGYQARCRPDSARRAAAARTGRCARRRGPSNPLRRRRVRRRGGAQRQHEHVQ